MGLRNYLIEGVSCAGKTTVCDELLRRGYQAIHGDRELAYQGDPETGAPMDTRSHENHIWDIAKVKALMASSEQEITFFCGGSRNFSQFIDLFDGVVVLDVDQATLAGRLENRPADEWGSKPAERELILRLHQTKEDIPRDGTVIDATRPLPAVVDHILSLAERPVSA
ncbi:MAG: AAA family ATPase [Tessaracoccus sp.]